jgi:hypothetical protein
VDAQELSSRIGTKRLVKMRVLFGVEEKNFDQKFFGEGFFCFS